MSDIQRDFSILTLKKCKLFYKAIQEGKTSFLLPDDDTGLTKLKGTKKYTYDFHQDFEEHHLPKNIRQRGNRIEEYDWDEQKSLRHLERIIPITRYFYQFHSNSVEIDKNIRKKWADFTSDSQDQENYEWQNQLLEYSDKWIPGFHYLFEFNWQAVTDKHHRRSSNFIFTDGWGIFIIVEVMFIPQGESRDDRSERNKKRKEVKEQAIKHRNKFFALNENNLEVIAILAATFTNEQGGLMEILNNDRHITNIVAALPETNENFNPSHDSSSKVKKDIFHKNESYSDTIVIKQQKQIKETLKKGNTEIWQKSSFSNETEETNHALESFTNGYNSTKLSTGSSSLFRDFMEILFLIALFIALPSNIFFPFLVIGYVLNL
ncbi:hypothetical protein G9A89_015249 [Geosiphon pyriformis]|nr:hypothetical protein G9A89_015249 [Geosiphon pyriformis]